MPFDPYKTVESVLDEAASSRRNLLRYLTTHPRQAAATAAAAVLAPLLVQSDQRGYFQSSLVTTPLVGAAAVAGPHLFQAGRDLATKLISFSRQSRDQIVRRAGVPSWEDLNAVKGTFHRGDVFLSQYEKAAQQYLGTQAAPADQLQRNLARQVTSLKRQFRRYLKSEANQALLANAVFAENYRAMGAAELAKFGHRALPPDWSWRDMWRVAAGRLGDEGFVRGMNFRMQQMGRLIDPGGSLTASDVRALGPVDDFGDPIHPRVRYRDFNKSPHFQNLLRAQRPDLFRELEDSFAAGKLDPARDRVILAAVGTEEDTGTMAGVRVLRKGHRPLDIYVQQSDGSVRLGEHFNRVGVSRQVLDLEMNQVLPADVYAVRAIGDDLDAVRGTLNKAQFGGFTDMAEDTFHTMAEGEAFSYQLDPLSIHARSRQVVIRGLEELGSKDREDALLQAMARHNLIKTWSEGSYAKGVVESAELSQVSPGGLFDPARQARQLRGLKPIQATEAISGIKFSGFHAPFSRTNYWENVRPGVTVPEFGTHIGGISAGLKSLVGDLPNKKKFLFDTKVKDSALASIMRDLRANGQEPTLGQAEKVWAQVRDYLRQGNNLNRVKKLGYLGEGDHLILGRNLPMPVAEKTYYVHQVRLNDLKGMVEGQKSFSKNTLLGFHNGTAITAGGTNNFLRGFQVMDDNRVALRVAEAGYAGIGKTDAHTKGLNINTHASEASAIRDFVNHYGQAAGTGAFVPPETEMLTVFHYSHNKANPGEQTINLGASLFRRLEASGELHEAAPYKNALEGLGLRYDSGTLLEDVHAFQDLDFPARTLRLQEIVDLINDMMDDVGSRLRTHQVRGDEFLQRFAGSADPLIDYMNKYASPVNAMMWNSLEQNVPGEAALTYDMFGHLYARGYHGVIKELRNNSRVDGDITQTRQVMEYLDRGDFRSPLGPALTPQQAVPGFDGTMKLSSVAERAQTIFDPVHPIAASNFSLRLSDGSHVPVLGHDAYGGKVNRYGAGQISTNQRESLLVDLLRTDAAGQETAAARQAYIGELRNFGYGKEGFLRARRIDPSGLAGFIQTAPSSTVGNPFEVAIGSDLLAQVRDAGARQSLEAGEDVFAAIARHPVSHVPLVKVRVDRRLNPNVVGIDEGLRGLMMADDDGDLVNMFFLDSRSDAWKEAKNAVYNPDSLQQRELKIQRALEGVEDDSRLARDIAYKSVRGAQVGLGETKTVEQIYRARTAGGAVGRYSNILTDLMLGLESSPTIVDPGQRGTLQRVFWALRQAPIAAQKSKAGNVTGLEDALKMANHLAYGLNNKTDKGFGVFYDSLLEISRSFGKSMPYNDDMQVLGLEQSLAVNGQINPLLKYVEANREAFYAYHQGRSDSVSKVARLLTATEESVSKYDGKILDGLEGFVPYLDPVLRRPRNPASSLAAASLGAINEGVTGAVREARTALAQPRVGGILAAGLGLAAAAGILSTSFATTPADFSSRSANAYRPETTAGTADHISGEPVAGSMAPSRPPRRIVPARPGVRTALVAPVHQAVNLEVRTKSPDRSRAAEQARMLALMSTDGDANVTVNVRQGLRNRSLRMREKLREMREQS